MTARKVPLEGWSPETSSLVDRVGRVLHYEGRILRGIRRDYAAEAVSTLRIAEANHWFDNGLVRTSLTDFETGEFPLVLEHERVPFVTLRGEWSAEALRRAALCYLQLSSLMAASGYGLKDAHTWNVLFRGTTPIMVDFGSIRPLTAIDPHAWLSEFNTYFVAPLLAFSNGETGLARTLLRDHLSGAGLWLLRHDPARLLHEPLPAIPADDPREMFSRLHTLVSGLRFAHTPSDWTAYAQPAAEGTEALRPKDVIVQQLLDRLRFETAIDLGANRGLHAFMCAARGASVLACDIDETCLDDMFLRATSSGRDLQPLYLDVALPGSSLGLFESIAPAVDRLRCDLVLALGLVHHVCYRWQVAPEVFAAGLARFTRNAAIVEFIPSDDWHVQQWPVPVPPDYSTDAMHGALLRAFTSVERLSSAPEPRCLFFCEGRR